MSACLLSSERSSERVEIARLRPNLHSIAVELVDLAIDHHLGSDVVALAPSGEGLRLKHHLRSVSAVDGDTKNHSHVNRPPVA